MRIGGYHKITLGLLVIVAPMFYKFIEQGCFGLLCISLMGIVLYILKHKERGNFSKIDICVILYLIYGACNLFFVKKNGIDCSFILQWVFLGSIYILARDVSKNKIEILYFMIFSGVIQAIIGILQLNAIIESGHPDFPMTGSFLNPGPYGGYLSLSLLSAIVIIIETKRKIIKYSSVILCLWLLVMLFLSGSRAALFAIVCGVVYSMFEKIKIKSKILRIAGVVVLLLMFCIILYFFRANSADARLLIWRVCMNIFTDNPLFGNGVASLPSLYMNRQADYFIATSSSVFTDVANNHGQAFNEFIHIACEQGITGLGLFFVILFFVFKSKCDRNIKALFVSLLLFSCFSYTADVLPLKMMFPLFIGLSANNTFYKVKFKRWIAVVPLLLISIVLCVNIHYKRAFDDLSLSKIPILPHNQDYMLQYAKMNPNIETLRYLTSHVYSSSEILCDMGDIHLTLGDTLSADSCYNRAFYMVPNRILPLYNLFLLYRGTDKALIYAIKIKDFKPIITNSLTLRAKTQSKEFLKYDNKNKE